MEFFKGISRMMGFDEEDDEELLENREENYDEGEEEIEIEPFVSKKQNKIVNIHTASSSKVVISKPSNYDEGKIIVDNLKSRRIVIVNLNGVEPKEGQRILDFLIGSIYALEGGLQPVEKGVFILTPSNIEVSNELKNELTNKGIFSSFK
ncbi:cell division protein SepF [Clostridium sp. UBA4395]|uniref:cell division protein SepF n=1 Tax=Clostridium sp. UBA4395 TaxID=1946360 RepID=UPI000E9FCFB4|nr:cell division protein SepF [Clostridium sp.]